MMCQVEGGSYKNAHTVKGGGGRRILSLEGVFVKVDQASGKNEILQQLKPILLF